MYVLFHSFHSTSLDPSLLCSKRFQFARWVSINFNMRRMDNRGDFIQRLGLDISIYILNLLEDPSDLVRACAVSHSWSRF
ncbi:hypothetical protein CMV_027483, partial [Castanea mollissima]